MESIVQVFECGWRDHEVVTGSRSVAIVVGFRTSAPHARDRHYATSRNWQAAWMIVNGEDAPGARTVPPEHTESGLW